MTRTLSATTLALGAALATAAALTPAPAAALDRYEDGGRISRAAFERTRAADATAQGVARVDVPIGAGARVRPASAAAPCPGGVGTNGGVFLNGTSLNGTSLNGLTLNGHTLQGRSPTGETATAGTGALRVTSVRLPDGRTFAVPAR